MGDRPDAQGPEWVIYDGLSIGEVLSFYQAGDEDAAFELCQSEDGAFGTTAEMQVGTVCSTTDGAKDTLLCVTHA